MRVIVVKQVIGRDVAIVMCAQSETCTMISPTVVIEGAGHVHNGNPYLVYGDACAKFTGCNKFDLTIVVAECVSNGIYSG